MTLQRTGRIATVVCALALAAAVASCSRQEVGRAGSAKSEIAVVIPGPNAYFDPWSAAAGDVGRKYGFSASFQVPPTEDFSLTDEDSLIDALAGRGYNGFALFPGDVNGTDAEEEKLANRGIPTINVNACTNDPSPALFCISTNVYSAAYFQAEQLIKAIGGHGDIAVLTSQLTDPNTQLRITAVKSAVAATGGKVRLAQVVANIDTPEAAPPAINALLAARGTSLDGVMSTSYNPSVAMATALTDSPQFRRIKFIGAENSPQVMTALTKGYIYGTLYQNTYGMAYAAAYALHRVIDDGCKVSRSAPWNSTAQTRKFIAASVQLVTKADSARYVGKPENLPGDTSRLIELINDKVLSC
jgi:ribose transport system substrate-binding protein